MGKMAADCRMSIGCLAAILLTYSAHADRVLVMAFNDTISKPWKWKAHGNYTGPFIDAMKDM